MSEILVNTIKKADGTGSITVPADTGTVLTTATAASSIPGYGNQITEVDHWRVTSNFTANGNVVTGWERPDTFNFTYIGTGITESSGVFTFPSTGKWLILYQARFISPGTSGSNKYGYSGMEFTTDGESSWDPINFAIDSVLDNDAYGSAAIQSFVDITSTSTHKMRFTAFSENNNLSLEGNTVTTRSGFTALRLGDT